MKATKLLAVLISLVLLGKAEATITRGQTFSGTTGSTNASSLALTVVAPDLTDGKYHYVVIAVSSNVVTSMTNDSGYSFTNSGMNTTNAAVCNLYVGRVFSGAGTTITVNVNSAAPIAAIGAEYTSDKPLRLDRAATGTSSATPSASGTTTATTNATEIAIAAHATRTTNSTTTGFYSTPSNSYSEIIAGGKSTNNNTSNNDRQVDMADKALSATGTTSNTMAYSTGNNSAGTVITLEEVVIPSTRIPSIGN